MHHEHHTGYEMEHDLCCTQQAGDSVASLGMEGRGKTRVAVRHCAATMGTFGTFLHQRVDLPVEVP